MLHSEVWGIVLKAKSCIFASNKGGKQNASSRHIGITWKMYALLILFVSFIVVCVWIFQAQMMTYLYQVAKFRDLEVSAEAISEELYDLERACLTSQLYADEHHVDVFLYRISDNGTSLEQIAEIKGINQGEISRQTEKASFLNDKIKEYNGSYLAVMSTKSFYEGENLKILREREMDQASNRLFYYSAEQISAVSASMYDTAEGERFIIIQVSNLTPGESMMFLLREQSIWIACILGVAALGLAFLMSRLITKPIVRMNESAKRLARGEYAADFVGSGYREISELADTLNYASTELAKTDNLQKELISNISHDLRTPLTMIKGYSEMMRDIPGENTPENIQIIIDETSRLSELVNDMLDISRIQSGTRKPELTLFSLTDTVRDTLNRYESLIRQDGYCVEFEADAEATVYADRGMILQVVYNLINNAINYTGEEKYVRVTQTVGDGVVRITVTDTGEGIPEEQLGLIWDRYYKVDKVHKRATVGTGLGLSIVKSILEQHDASYGVQSVLGKGSTFWFELNLSISDEFGEVQGGYIEADYEFQKMKE